MNILITGGSGFVGQALTDFFTANQHTVTILSRRKRPTTNRYLSYLEWNGKEMPLGIGLYDVVINLAGANIAGKRWSTAYKQEILESRVNATKACVAYINNSNRPPEVFISMSAVGYYGQTGDRHVDESTGPGDDFMGQVGNSWEAAAQAAQCRTVITRLGVVMGKGGALERMIPIYNMMLGGKFGAGKQGYPWIHIDDVVKAMLFVIDQSDISGPVNFVAPQQIDQATFSHALGKALNRPDPWIVPGFAIKLLFGNEMSDIFLGGQWVTPGVLLEAGYPFEYPEIEAALADAV